MSHWTSRIALVAYVIGGWLLPAMHNHHDQGVGDASSACCEIVFDSVEAPMRSGEGGSDCQGCGDHQHETDVSGVADSGSVVHLDVGSSSRLISGHRLDACVGLCLLCSARSLSGDRVADRPVFFCDLPIICRKDGSTSLKHLLDQPLGSDPARGPPSIV